MRICSSDLTATKVLVELPYRVARGEPLDVDLMEDRFFHSIKLRNKTYKTTGRRRLASFDALFNRCLKEADASPVDFLDVAASSGIATREWLDNLADLGLRPKMVASDVTMTAFLITLFHGFRVLVDVDNFPLQFDFCGCRINAQVKKIDLVTGHWLLVLAARCLYRMASAWFGLRERLVKNVISGGNADQTFIRQVTLVSLRVRERGDIVCINDDILQRNPNSMVARFDVVRAANILNHIYFPAGELRQMIANLEQRLRGDGSWLLVCRTLDDGSNHGSIFRLNQDRRFLLVARVGQGSEVESMILG